VNEIATIEKPVVADEGIKPKKAKKLKIKKSALARKAAYFILYVPNMEEAVAFYKRIGLKLGHESAEWTEFKAGGIKFALHLAGQPKAEGACQSESGAEGACASPSFKAQKTTFTFGVKNAGKTYEAFKTLGVKVLGEPFEVCEDGRSFAFEDPFGNELSIFGR
jgi:predicted enzyme related to lactoylglutathione lyase